MKKPRERPGLPKRLADNEKRRLSPHPEPEQIADLVEKVSYEGSSKHKRNPHLYGLPPFTGPRGDATLCDEHAGFEVADMETIPRLIGRGIRAGLIGTAVWTVADNGWIYEARVTNVTRSEYHGYPVRPSEAIAEVVYERFRNWAEKNGSELDKNAAQNCRALYGFK